MSEEKEPKAPRKKKASTETKSLKALGIERFETREIHRSLLNAAPYNPRTLGDEERRRLKRVLKKNGMVFPITWNERSGNIVAGHQRTKIMDALAGTSDYLLTVAVVNVDDKTERELVIATNNEEAQGSWDLEKLADVFRPGDLDLDATGFSMADLATFFGEDVTSKQDPAALDALADRLRERRDAQESHLQKLATKRDSPSFYACVVFNDEAELDRWRERFGFALDEMCVDGRAVSRAMGLDLEEDPPAEP